MIKRFLTTILLILTSLFALAQDRPANNSKPDSIINKIPTEVIGHTQYDYNINGKKQTAENVKARLYAYAPSKIELLKSSQQTTYFGLSIIGFGLSGVGATLEYIDNEGSGPHHNLNSAYALTGAATAFAVSAIFHCLSAKRHSHKAMVLYNQRYEQ